MIVLISETHSEEEEAQMRRSTNVNNSSKKTIQNVTKQWKNDDGCQFFTEADLIWEAYYVFINFGQVYKDVCDYAGKYSTIKIHKYLQLNYDHHEINKFPYKSSIFLASMPINTTNCPITKQF